MENTHITQLYNAFLQVNGGKGEYITAKEMLVGKEINESDKKLIKFNKIKRRAKARKNAKESEVNK